MNQRFLIEDRAFDFACEDEISIGFSLEESSEEVACYRVSFEWDHNAVPHTVTLSYEIPAIDLYYMWDPINPLRNLSFSYRATESRLPTGMPLKSLVSRDGTNAYLLAVSDVKTPISVKMRMNNERPVVMIQLEFFTMLCGPFQKYDALIRVDRRRIPFDEAIYCARKWYDALGYQNSYVPDDAGRPMYSTWYSYTKNIHAKAALEECREAVKFGIDTVIVDDGWQTDRYDSMYGNCGDWHPAASKFPNMKEFVDEVHALGMKAMLWYATPFMGEFAQACPDYSETVLGYSEAIRAYCLDPRYPHVRAFLVETFAHAVRDWGFDGLKLDFIDRFKTNGEYNEKMDVFSVEDATERLLSEVNTALRAINPNVMIEFRQPYFGPVVSKYGNMMRVWDCPMDSARNRIQSLNLRLVCGACAVHSDMIVWNVCDTPENVAQQLWGTMFSVPQISVRMEELNEDHAKVLRNYLDFWNAHRQALAFARVRMTLCENGYGTAWAENGQEKIVMLADASVYEWNAAHKDTYLINLTDRKSIIIKNDREQAFCVSVYDCMGECLVDQRACNERFCEITAPIGARVVIKKEN